MQVSSAQGAAKGHLLPSFFLAEDLPGSIRQSLSTLVGSLAPLPQEGGEISGMMEVLKTQD